MRATLEPSLLYPNGLYEATQRLSRCLSRFCVRERLRDREREERAAAVRDAAVFRFSLEEERNEKKMLHLDFSISIFTSPRP